jgi:hypothetical protein
MAWIVYRGEPIEVDIVRRPITIFEVYARAKDKSFSIPVMDEKIYETIDDYNRERRAACQRQ